MTKTQVLFRIKTNGNHNELHTRGSRREIALLLLDALVHSSVAREILGEVLLEVQTRAVGAASAPYSLKTAKNNASRSNRKKRKVVQAL